MEQHASKKRKTDSSRSEGTLITDSRFANIQSDPRFKLPGRRQRVKVDKRFAKALQDEDFSRKARVDRYGRPLETDSEKKRLKRKYEFEDDLEESEESDDADDDNEVQAELKRLEHSEPRDILREGKDVSSSEEDSSSEEESDQEEEDVDTAGPGLQDRDVPMGEVSSRLAVVNLDWDNIRAEDLMAVFQSFLPAGGRLLKVAVYPSEFGRERMQKEELEGPPKEIFARKEEGSLSESEFEDDEEIKNAIIQPDDGSEFDTTALRQYQLDRLRYFFAILTFSNSETAKVIYDAVDGTEYLSTANFFDLRFVPDETEFLNDEPREECGRLPPGYKPNDFVTDALQHSKVKLTWDAEDASRKEAQARAFRGGRHDIDDDDLRAYLGSSSESEGEEDDANSAANAPSKSTGALSKKDAERQRMRALLGLAPEPIKTSKKDKADKPMGNIQITFSSGLAGPAVDEVDENNSTKPKSKRSVFINSPEPDETTMEKYIRKEKERKQRRKEKMKTSRDGITTTDPQPAEPTTHEPTEDQQDLGFDDPFFTEPTLAAQTANKQRKAERQKRRQEREAEEAASATQRAELEKVLASIDNDQRPNPPPSTAGGRPPGPGRTVKHFDMHEIEKAEKALSKPHRKAKTKNNKSKPGSSGPVDADHETVLANDDFKMDARDPRFARLYENHEFAIDPTNSRFKGTRGMKALLEEGRNRKDGRDGKKKGKSGLDATKTGGDDEVMGLVEKIRKKTQKRK